jgi:protoporphyrinogen/coproporphyrinogen III oxidase
MDRTLRIGVVGAGCAGLSAAEELRERGYGRVTVLEAGRGPGGKVHSREHVEGPRRTVYEVGTVWFIPGPVYERYLERHGLAGELGTTPPLTVLDLETRRSYNPFLASSKVPVPSRLAQVARAVLTLGEWSNPREPGFSHPRYRDAAMPSPEYFAREGLDFVREALIPVANAAQFGPLEPRVPAAYVLKLIALLLRYDPIKLLTLSLPKIRLGNQELWRRLAARHEVRYEAAVQRVERGRTIRVHTAAGEFEFDRLIWAAPMEEFLAVADASETEKNVFGRVRGMRRAVLTCKASGLGPAAIHALRQSLDAGLPASYPHVFFEVEPGSGLYNFYPYMEESTTLEELEQQMRELIRRLGGSGGELVAPPRVLKWFPHFSSEDMASGTYERIESMQGERGTWFTGELFSGVGVAYGTEYSARLVERYFE